MVDRRRVEELPSSGESSGRAHCLRKEAGGTAAGVFSRAGRGAEERVEVKEKVWGVIAGEG